MNRSEEKLTKKSEKRKKQKQKQKEKQRKETTQVWDFMKKAEQKKSALKKLKEKKLVETKSALKKFARQFTVEGDPVFNPKSFFNVTKVSLLRILRKNRQTKVKLIRKCLMKRIDLKTGEETKTEAAFHYENKINLPATKKKKLLTSMIEEVLENMAKFQRRGSNWRFEEILKLELHLVEFDPLKGNSWIPLPEKIAKKKAVINMKNEDDECFKWCVARALSPVENHPERITQKLRKQAEELNWKSREFPMEKDKIEKFEKNNPFVSVNVFYLDGSVHSLRISEVERENNIDLLLIEEDVKKHYCLIKNLSRLLSKQVAEDEKPKVFCRRCLNHFPNNEKLEVHKEYCSRKECVKIEMPEIKNRQKWRRSKKT